MKKRTKKYKLVKKRYKLVKKCHRLVKKSNKESQTSDKKPLKKVAISEKMLQICKKKSDKLVNKMKESNNLV